jgi:hypothetical protein
MQRRDMLPSKYLKQSDFDTVGTILTISHVTQKQNVAKSEEAPDMKHVLFFNEMGDVGLVLNALNTNFLFDQLGENSSEWSGQEVVLFVDPNVTFGEKRVGGLRIRAHAAYQAPKAAPPRPPGAFAQNTAPSSHSPARLLSRAPPQHDDDVPY